jgi:hypothetical protein
MLQAAYIMGRGGTKFESEAIGNRDGRQKKGPSLKDLKKEMEVRPSTVSVKECHSVVHYLWQIWGFDSRLSSCIFSNLSGRRITDGRNALRTPSRILGRNALAGRRGKDTMNVVSMDCVADLEQICRYAFESHAPHLIIILTFTRSPLGVAQKIIGL